MLTTVLWPDLDIGSARNNLRVTLNRLRGQLKDAGLPRDLLLTRPADHVALDPLRSSTDVRAFTVALQEAERFRDDTLQQRYALERAVGVYNGPLLPDLDDHWIIGLRRRYEEACIIALTDLSLLCRLLKDNSAAIRYAYQAIEMDPLREESHRNLIRILHEAGRPGAAKRQYGDLERTLQERMGIKPSEVTLLMLGDSAPESQAPEVPSRVEIGPMNHPMVIVAPKSSTSTWNVPVVSTAFFGRERECDEIGLALLDPTLRLLNLVGPAGVGKTRLAIETVHQFPGESLSRCTWWVDLSNAVTFDDVISTILSIVIGFNNDKSIILSIQKSKKSVLDRLASIMRRYRALLVLDNVDHLDFAEFKRCLIFLLEKAPAAAVMITSRRRIRLSGEFVMAINPLPVPSEFPVGQTTTSEACSIQLFVNRAQMSAPGFTLTQNNLEVIKDICRKVGGLPLAIEMVAERVSNMTVDQISSRINDSLAIISSNLINPISKHKSLKSAVESDFRLLSKDEADIISAMSVFHSGWSIDMAEEILSMDNEAEKIYRLVDKNIIRYSNDKSGRKFYINIWYKLVMDRLFGNKTSKYSVNVIEYFHKKVLLLNTQEEKCEFVQTESLEILNVVRMVLSDANEYKLGLCIDVIASLAPVIWAKGLFFIYRSEFSELVDRCLRCKVDSVKTDYIAYFACLSGAFQYTKDRNGNDIEDKVADIVNKYGNSFQKGVINQVMGNLDKSIELFSAIIDNIDIVDLGNEINKIYTMINISSCFMRKGEFSAAMGYLDLAISCSHRIDDKSCIAAIFCTSSLLNAYMGNIDNAISDSKKSLFIFESIGNFHGANRAKFVSAKSYISLGEMEKAASYLLDSIDFISAVSDTEGLIFISRQLADAFYSIRQFDECALACACYRRFCFLCRMPLTLFESTQMEEIEVECFEKVKNYSNMLMPGYGLPETISVLRYLLYRLSKNGQYIVDGLNS